ncbi:4Fe-4S binding protein [Nonomuraea sp. NPDC049400]|uniref:NuoI/complex I 23 kDa subunit family protein n=1 Tax=Nonomuraea sp. NPDC049400 TaxID=3364352 RepID=UPI0037886EC9
MMLNMARIPGVGLAKGLSITLRHMLRKSVTQQYPEVKPALPPRSRGVIALVEENCTSCMLCARECPDWCIYIDSHKETIPAPEGGRPRQRNVLDRFAIDFSLCMYCGICIEVCPFDALFWSPEFEYAEGDIRNLIHEKDKLATWTQTVPLPPAHDPGADPPKELTAAPRRPATARTPGAARPTPPSGTADRPSTKRPQEPSTPRATTTKEEPAPKEPQTPTDARPTQDTSSTLPPERTSGTRPTQGTSGTLPPEGTSGVRPTQDTSGAQPAEGVSDTEPADTPDTKFTAGTTEAMPKPGPSQAEAGAQDAGPTASAPESGPDTPSRAQRGVGRPRRPMQNVRGIRPPGALPSRTQDETPISSAEGQPLSGPATPAETNAGTPAEAEPNLTLPTEDGQPTTTSSTKDDQTAATSSGEDGESTATSSGADGESTATSSGADGESTTDSSSTEKGAPTAYPSADQPPQGSSPSTGQPSPEKLSTASGVPQPAPDPEQQTSATSPRRRRMADPRSIRPPGRLGPDETRESEEES